MYEDKLNNDERLKLESLAQAIKLHSHIPMPQNTPKEIVATAKIFESYIRTKKAVN